MKLQKKKKKVFFIKKANSFVVTVDEYCLVIDNLYILKYQISDARIAFKTKMVNKISTSVRNRANFR
jgi:predicted transcriptional regulator